MPFLLVVIIAASLFWVSTLNSKQANPADPVNMVNYVANDIAEDLLFDLNIANEYANKNPTTEGLIKSDELSAFYKPLYKDKKKDNLAEFRAYIFSYNESQTISKYVLVAWNSVNPRIMALSPIESNVIGSLVQISTQQPGGLTPIIVGTNYQLDCNISINSMIKKHEMEEKYKKIFKDICISERSSKDWLYVIFKKIQ